MGEHLMNILVIGNGMDLAHKLPTTYIDFLDAIKYIDKDLKVAGKDVNGNVVKELIKIKNTNKELFDEIKNLSTENRWIKYFNTRKNQDKGWIDFELEISRVIQLIENLRENLRENQVDERDV